MTWSGSITSLFAGASQPLCVESLTAWLNFENTNLVPGIFTLTQVYYEEVIKAASIPT